jgi:hypothetical protein
MQPQQPAGAAAQVMARACNFPYDYGRYARLPLLKRRKMLQVQRAEGVLVPGRQNLSATREVQAPPSNVALPVKNNAILQESLGILREFRALVEHGRNVQQDVQKIES